MIILFASTKVSAKTLTTLPDVLVVIGVQTFASWSSYDDNQTPEKTQTRHDSWGDHRLVADVIHGSF